jgi:hypothetical protein
MTGKSPFLLAVLCAVLSGCSTLSRQGPPKFNVAGSFLDYVTFTYHAAGGISPGEHPVMVRIELSGSGHVSYAKGRSSRVQNSFWTDREEKYVDDIQTDQIVLRDGQVREILQSLVDAGIFERKIQNSQVEDPLHESVFIHAKISNRRGAIITDSKAFLDIYKKLAQQFAR